MRGGVVELSLRHAAQSYETVMLRAVTASRHCKPVRKSYETIVNQPKQSFVRIKNGH